VSRGRAPSTPGRPLAVVALALALCVVAAQTPVPGEVSFEAAVAVARERNPAYLRQRNQVASSQYGERQSFGQAFLPSLSGSVGFGASNSLRQSWEEDSGEIQSGSVESTSSSASQGISTSVSLFDWRRVQSYRAARSETDAAEAAVAWQAAQLRTAVGRAYFDVVQRRRLADVERRTLAAARDQLEAVQALLRVAAKQPTDVLGAELAVLQAEQSLQQAEGEARKADLQLREVMGVPLESEFELTTGFAAVFDPTALDPDALVGRALGSSPLMAEQAARVAAADRSLSAARAARFPSVSMSGSWNRGVSAQELDALGEFDLPNRTYSASLGVSIPLFNQLSTSAAVGRASIGLDDAEMAMREARLQLEREVRAAVIDLENAHTGVQVAERSVEIARERLDQGQELYRLGSLDYTALQQMIDQVAARERALVGARFQFVVALLQLEEKIGGPLER
jgi:outer membrane protein